MVRTVISSSRLTALLLLAIFAASVLAACSTTKTTSPAPVATTPAPAAKPSTGIYDPGNEELLAIQTRYPATTLEQLHTGYVLYAKGACINCHEAKAIYQYNHEQWKDIVDEMAAKARMSTSEKDAVYKYVIAIKEVRKG